MRTIVPTSVERVAHMTCEVTSQKTGGTVKLRLTDEQMRILDVLSRSRRTIILKGRQIGASTVCCLYDAMMALTNDGCNVAIVADTADKAQRLLSITAGFLKRIGAKLATDNVRSITLANGSTIDALSAVSRAADGESRVGRSKSYAVIHCTEMAFWYDDAATFAALTSTALPVARIVIESTATGTDSLFRRIWSSGEGWDHLFFSVEDHENYRLKADTISESAWHEAQSKYGFTRRDSAAWWLTRCKTEFAGDDVRMLREYPIRPEHAFQAAAGRWIRKYKRAAYIVEQGDWQYYDQTPEHLVMGVDTATGVAKDASAIAIIDRVTGHPVATYRCNTVPVPEFVRICRAAIDKHKPQAVVVESNGIGAAVLQMLREGPSPVYEQESSAANGEKYVRLSRLRFLIEEGHLPIGGHLIYEAEHAITDDAGRYKGADDVLNALSFAIKFSDENPLRIATPVVDDREVFVPKHKKAKRVLY